MALHTGRIQPCLWFDNQGEQAARFYTEVFPDSRITAIARYGEAGHDIHGRPAGSVMTVQFELDGHPVLLGIPFGRSRHFVYGGTTLCAGPFNALDYNETF
jgi:predicted 3-demethylubiquinone-9 3-methyltransferase (glyoxalase superfamily)